MARKSDVALVILKPNAEVYLGPSKAKYMTVDPQCVVSDETRGENARHDWRKAL